MIEVGRLCVKTAGRDAGKKCVVVEVVDKSYAIIDGETRRKRANIRHLEPMSKKIELKQGASHDDVVKAFDELGIKIVPRVVKERAAPKKGEPEAKKEEKKKPAKKAAKQE